MFDFLARKSVAIRRSVMFTVLVVATEAFTAIMTGVVIGYLLMFPVVFGFAAAEANRHQRDKESAGERLADHSSSHHQRLDGYQRRSDALHCFIQAFDDATPDDQRCVDPARVFWFTSLISIVAVAAGLIITTATHRYLLDRRGGWAIGLAIGATAIDPRNNPLHRRLQNIVEELAVAYAMQPPAVLVMEGESGINALAVGLGEDDRIIVVTSGAIERFDRDELQAVIAHEYSHLRHGDTKMGTQLTAILEGLQGIRLLAEGMIDSGLHIARHSERDGGQGYLLVLVGVAIWPLGVFGAMSATLLTLATGRNRERLADAEAVAQTRHPEPLARALRKIAGHPSRGRLRHPKSTLVAPMLFVARTREHHWFCTHPPISERLAAIDPAGDHSPIYDEKLLKRGVQSASPHTETMLNWLFSGIVLASNESETAKPATSPIKRSPRDTKASALVLLSAISCCDGESAMTDYEFMRGWIPLDLGDASRVPADQLSDALVDSAIEHLSGLNPLQKRDLLVAIADTASADAELSEAEAELIARIQSSWGIKLPTESDPRHLVSSQESQ